MGCAKKKKKKIWPIITEIGVSFLTAGATESPELDISLDLEDNKSGTESSFAVRVERGARTVIFATRSLVSSSSAGVISRNGREL